MDTLQQTESQEGRSRPDPLNALNEKDSFEIQKLLAISRSAATALRRSEIEHLEAQASNVVRWLLHRLLRERCHIVFTSLKRKKPETVFTIDLKNRLFDHVALKPPIRFENISLSDCSALIDRLIEELSRDSEARSHIQAADLTYFR